MNHGSEQRKFLRARYASRGPVAHAAIEEESFERPVLTTGQALVEVLAAPINPSDVLTLTGEYGVLPPLPSLAGSEGAGRVLELGPNTEGPPVGARVLLPPGAGTWATHVVVPAARLLPLPAEGDVEQFAMLTINPPTAALLLRDFVSLKSGDWVLQNAANSGVGSAVMQLAKPLGLKTISLVRREAAVAQVRGLGGDVVLVDGPQLAERVREATGGAPVRLAFDAVGGDATQRLASAVSEGGTVVNYGALSGQPCMASPRDLVFRDVTLRGFWLARWFRSTSPAAQGELMRELAGFVAAGTLRTPVHARFPVERIKEAVAAAAAGERSGKVLIVASAK